MVLTKEAVGGGWRGGRTGAAIGGESERVDRLMRTRGPQRRGPTHHAGSSQSRRRGKLRYVGRARHRLWLEITAAVYEFVRVAKP